MDFRKDTKTIYLRNSTQLPVAWKLSGLENLGDDFTVAADSGVVEPLSEYPLQAYFRAMKAVQTSKKMIRLEVGDRCCCYNYILYLYFGFYFTYLSINNEHVFFFVCIL